MEDTIAVRENKNNINGSLTILFICIGYILLYYMVNDIVRYEMFVHTIYATFLIAMGIIAFKTIEFNVDKFCIFLGAIFIITGVIESMNVLIKVMNEGNIYYINNFEIILTVFVDILPIIGIYISFNYIEKERNVFKDIIIMTIIIILLIVISTIIIFNNNKFIKIDLMRDEFKILIEFVINGFLLIMGIIIYKKVDRIDDYLDNKEKKYFKQMIIIIALSRITTLISPIINSYAIEDILSQIITNIAIIYIYRYMVYTNFSKPYNKVNYMNEELVKKTNILRENNNELIIQTKKIQSLKDILYKEELKLQSTLDVSVNCIIVFNKDKEITYANKKFESSFGYKYNDQNCNNKIDLTSKIKNFEEFIKNVDIVFSDNENIKQVIKTNENKTYYATFSPLIIKEEIQGALCILINKTKQIEYGKKIIYANERYEKFLESMSDGIIVLKNDKKIYANKASYNIFKEKINFIDFSIYKGEKSIEEHFKIEGKDIFLEMDFSYYMKNEECKTIIVLRDITSRKKAQNKLKQNQKAYSKFIDILPDGICLLNEELQITYANKSLLEMLEMNSLYQINNNIKNIMNLSINEEELFDKKMRMLFEKNKNMLLLEYEIITYNKNKVQVEVNALPFFNENNYIMLIIKDLTYKKTSEMAEKEILDRFKTDKIKTEFFANMSHELKTPLNVISSSNQLLDSLYRNKKVEDYNNSTKAHIDLVRQSSHRLQRLIGNIIDLTKMESGFYNLKLFRYNIVNVIEDLFIKVDEYARKKDINLIFDTDDEDIYVYIDKSEIERIILNLLSNCIKFTNIGGNINVNIYNKGDKVIINVCDDGIGIPKNKINLIFEEFGQADKTLSRNAEGSGIGLSVVKNLVELHGGNIYVKSEENKGTEFIINIPTTNINKDEYKEDRRIYNIDEKIEIEFSDIYY